MRRLDLQQTLYRLRYGGRHGIAELTYLYTCGGSWIPLSIRLAFDITWANKFKSVITWQRGKVSKILIWSSKRSAGDCWKCCRCTIWKKYGWLSLSQTLITETTFYVKVSKGRIKDKTGWVCYVQSTLAISNSKGLTETLRDIRTSTYQSWESEENNKLNNHI